MIKSNKIFNICNLYVFLWLLMKTQGILYKPVFISVASYIFVVVISLYFAVKCYVTTNNPPFVIAYNILFALFCIYGVINLAFADTLTTYKNIAPDFYLQNIVQSMMPFYAFYAFAQKKMISTNWLRVFMIVFLTVTIITYYNKESSLLQNATSEIEGVTNNVGYIFVSLLPLACFWNSKKIIQYALLALCAFFIIMSMKRGAILTGGAVIILFIWLGARNSKNYKQTHTQRLLNLVLSMAIIYIGYKFVLFLLDTNLYFGNRVEETLEGYSSQRDYLYSYYWNLFWDESNPFQYLFGRGADGTIHTGHNYAHNDWLEILVNQGFLGIFVFVLFWIRLFKLIMRNRIQIIVKTSLGMCALSLFIKTFFSMSINEMPIYSTCIMGVTIAAYYNKEIASLISE